MDIVTGNFIRLLRRNVRFTPTQPNVLNIEKMMIVELEKEKACSQV